MSVYLGRVVEDGEPEWLPEDRDVVEVWQYYESTRHADCGRWEWEWESVEEKILDYDVCPFCDQVSRFAARTSEARDGRMAGVQFRYYDEEREELKDGN